jgi:hypothetical protein
MDNLKNNSNRQRERRKTHRANRRYSLYKCLKCGKFLRDDPRLFNNEEVWQYCFCNCFNIFTWNNALDMIQRIKIATIDYIEFCKLPKLANHTRKNRKTEVT